MRNEEKMVRDRGFEPLTPSVSRKCSTTELTAPGESKDRYETLCFHRSFATFCVGQALSFRPVWQGQKHARSGQKSERKCPTISRAAHEKQNQARPGRSP